MSQLLAVSRDFEAVAVDELDAQQKRISGGSQDQKRRRLTKGRWSQSVSLPRPKSSHGRLSFGAARSSSISPLASPTYVASPRGSSEFYLKRGLSFLDSDPALPQLPEAFHASKGVTGHTARRSTEESRTSLSSGEPENDGRQVRRNASRVSSPSLCSDPLARIPLEIGPRGSTDIVGQRNEVLSGPEPTSPPAISHPPSTVRTATADLSPATTTVTATASVATPDKTTRKLLKPGPGGGGSRRASATPKLPSPRPEQDVNGSVHDVVLDIRGSCDSDDLPRRELTRSPSTDSELVFAPIHLSTSDDDLTDVASTFYTDSYSAHSTDTLPPPVFSSRRSSYVDASMKSRPSSPDSFIDLGPSTRELRSQSLPRRVASSPVPSQRGSIDKPPVPTSPKPDFGNRSSANLSLRKKSPQPVPGAGSQTGDVSRDKLPPTTNYLHPAERSDLVRKTRKLAQVFGQTPEAAALSGQESKVANFLDLPPSPLSPRGRHPQHLRGAASVSVAGEGQSRHVPGQWPPPEETQYLSASGRRHSTPYAIDQFSFLESRSTTTLTTTSESTVARNSGATVSAFLPNGAVILEPPSATSFIDLDEDDATGPDDGVSAIISSDGRHRGRTTITASPTAQSFLESLSPEEQAEEERRRKREKLAKLHRFLGSRIPTELALGLPDGGEATLPPLPSPSMESSHDDMSRPAWLKRRRSTSATIHPSSWSDDVDRLKEELNETEKALNVRRAVKMEKVFGVAPPQTLYHTRHAPSTSTPSGVPPVPPLPDVSRTTAAEYFSTPVSTLSAPFKAKKKKNSRPGTAESSKQLLRQDSIDDYGNEPSYRVTLQHPTSLVYSQYQHSLNSLNDIIDRDDKESLAEFYMHATGDSIAELPHLPQTQPGAGRARSSSVRSDRRHSLPSIKSFSMASDTASIASPPPDVTDFQMRRRRAAKLTQFFGVNHRDLVKNVLDSIEDGLEHEKKRGTLQPQEAEDLLAKLRTLKTKRDGVY